MKSGHPISNGAHRKFRKSHTRRQVSIYLDADVEKMVKKFARKNKMKFDEAVNELLLRALPKTAAESFRQGWKEAMTGKTFPISELWKDIEI